MTPNLRHLLAFSAVARLGSVSKAARFLNLSQPAVSQELAILEADLGTRLFERTPTGLKLTEAGALAKPRIERAVELLRDGFAQIARTAAASSSPAAIRRVGPAPLELLVMVVGAGSIAGASREAGRSRSGIHRALRQLEQSTGTSLFETTSHGLRPTREAEQLALRVQLSLAELRQARDEVGALLGAESGTTVVGAMPLARSHLVPAVILEFSRRQPRHAISILDGPYDSLLKSLRSGAADWLIGALRSPPPADDVVQEHLFDDPLALVVRSGHPLAAKDRVGLKDLRGYSWIAPRRGSPLRKHHDSLLQQAGAGGDAAAIECNSLVAARALLVASDRIMLLSERQIEHEVAIGELAALAHPLGRVTRPIGLTLRKGWRPTPVQQQLLETVRLRARLRSSADVHVSSDPAAARNALGEARRRREKKRVK